MTSESNRISSASTAYVQGISASWGWTWQAMSQENDDGIDGLLYLRTKKISKQKPTDRRFWKHTFTGGMIHVQIKSGESYISEETADHILLSVANLKEKRALWEMSPLPCALVFVQAARQSDVPKRAWWVDLKVGQTYINEGKITIPKKNRFQAGIECIKPFARLARRQMLGSQLQVVDHTSSSPKQLSLLGKNPLKWEAWRFYNEWKQQKSVHPSLGLVSINRTGWSHITRPGRPLQRIINSFQLLPVAAQIINEVKDWRVLSRAKSIKENADGSWAVIEFLGISAHVLWPYRAPSEVMVILRKKTTFRSLNPSDRASFSQDIRMDTKDEEDLKHAEVKLWFYSVYEPGRGKK